ncbi:MAG: nucleotide exchange factor GrpE [Deltaproteobacteria bacterium]|nr:nucleotide exchange factor GrpE [Deltaproteobacteria bacterium]
MQADQNNTQTDPSIPKDVQNSSHQVDSGETNPQSEPGDDERAKLQDEIKDLKDKYVRVHADMENMRRRQERERLDLMKFGLETIFKDLLPVLDSFEKAIPEDCSVKALTDPASVEAFAEGMIMVRRQLVEVCSKHGLEPIVAKDAPFDPHLHQAIQRIDSADVKIDTVGNEYARGYQLHGRLIRPAMVSVLTPSGG